MAVTALRLGEVWRTVTQGSSCLATLGFGTQAPLGLTKESYSGRSHQVAGR